MDDATERKLAEAAMQRLIEDEGLPEPDDFEYRDDRLVLLWHERQLAVAVDLAP